MLNGNIIKIAAIFILNFVAMNIDSEFYIERRKKSVRFFHWDFVRGNIWYCSYVFIAGRFS